MSSKRDNNNLNEGAQLKDLLIKNSKNSLLENYLLGKKELIFLLSSNDEDLIALKNKIVGQGGIWAYKTISRDFKEELGDLSLQFLKEGYENGDINSGYDYAKSLIENSNDVQEIDKGINILVNDVYIYDDLGTSGIISNINKYIPKVILEIKLKGDYYKKPSPPITAVKRLNEYLNILNTDLNTIVSTLNSFKAEKQEFLTFVQDARNQWTNIFQQFLTNFPKQPTFMIAQNFPKPFVNGLILELLKFPERSQLFKIHEYFENIISLGFHEASLAKKIESILFESTHESQTITFDYFVKTIESYTKNDTFFSKDNLENIKNLSSHIQRFKENIIEMIKETQYERATQ